MPSALAIGAITTTGYAGILVGPAAIGRKSTSAWEGKPRSRNRFELRRP
jgi:hypothetical protein